jgi:hypothetical protein
MDRQEINNDDKIMLCRFARPTCDILSYYIKFIYNKFLDPSLCPSETTFKNPDLSSNLGIPAEPIDKIHPDGGGSKGWISDGGRKGLKIIAPMEEGWLPETRS